MDSDRLVAQRRVCSYRPNDEMRARLQAEADRNGRSLSKEVELRVAASFSDDRAPDLRTLIREEIRAALAERNESLMNAALAMVAETPVPPKIYRY